MVVFLQRCAIRETDTGMRQLRAKGLYDPSGDTNASMTATRTRSPAIAPASARCRARETRLWIDHPS